jgi:hypothetical protein
MKNGNKHIKEKKKKENVSISHMFRKRKKGTYLCQAS